jgi:hypothetical protein
MVPVIQGWQIVNDCYIYISLFYCRVKRIKIHSFEFQPDGFLRKYSTVSGSDNRDEANGSLIDSR